MTKQTPSLLWGLCDKTSLLFSGPFSFYILSMQTVDRYKCEISVNIGSIGCLNLMASVQITPRKWHLAHLVFGWFGIWLSTMRNHPKTKCAKCHFRGAICTEAIKFRPQWTSYSTKFHKCVLYTPCTLMMLMPDALSVVVRSIQFCNLSFNPSIKYLFTSPLGILVFIDSSDLKFPVQIMGWLSRSHYRKVIIKLPRSEGLKRWAFKNEPTLQVSRYGKNRDRIPTRGKWMLSNQFTKNLLQLLLSRIFIQMRLVSTPELFWVV